RPFINRENLDTDISVTINTTAVINCPVSGDPQPDVVWYKNGVPFDATNQPRYEVLGEGRQLRIYNAQLTDVGVYTCAAKSRAGEDAIDYNINILVPPIIGRINVNIYPKVLKDSSVVIYCPAQGVPTPSISWFKDGQPLEEKPGVIETRSEGTELVLHNAKIVDAGRYECVAKNPAGESSQVYELDVQVIPTISLTDLNTTHNVIENRTVVLECPAEGTPTPTILWFYRGIPLDSDSDPGLTISEDGTRLRIASVQITDAGAYVCIATNEAGDAELDHILSVLVPPVVDHNAVDANPRVIKGHTAIINCPVSSVPFPDIEWTNAGKPVIEDTRVEILSSGLQLRITSAEESDAAQYACVASNPAGEVSLDFDLVVLVPPSIDESNVVYDRKVNQGRTVQMACPVHGEPAPTVSWLLNGRPIQALDRVRILENNLVLEIDGVKLTDSARYTCIATNEAGQLERNFDLEVLLRPTIDNESVQTTIVVTRNKTARFNCLASGTPHPNITWTRHGKPLRSSPHPTIRLLGDGQTLELSDAQISDAGRYTCRATNAAGTDSLQYELKVYVLPTINNEMPDHLHVTQGRSISMRCTARGTPEPNIIWMKDENILALEDDPRLKLLDKESTLQLTDAQPDDAAKYTCHAENEAGYAEKFFHLQVYGLQHTFNCPKRRLWYNLEVDWGVKIRTIKPKDSDVFRNVWTREGEVFALHDSNVIIKKSEAVDQFCARASERGLTQQGKTQGRSQLTSRSHQEEAPGRKHSTNNQFNNIASQDTPDLDSARPSTPAETRKQGQ
ncbi:hemicentin-1, partial [Elysia marginata]